MESPDVLGAHADALDHGGEQIGNRRLALIDDVASGANEVAAASGAAGSATDRACARCHPRGRCRKRSAIGRAGCESPSLVFFSFGQELGEQLQVQSIDLPHLVEHLHVAHVMGERMVAVGDADFRIRRAWSLRGRS